MVGEGSVLFLQEWRYGIGEKSSDAPQSYLLPTNVGHKIARRPRERFRNSVVGAEGRGRYGAAPLGTFDLGGAPLGFEFNADDVETIFRKPICDTFAGQVSVREGDGGFVVVNRMQIIS
mmetsp:Transcript_16084/g.24136  ORF Transcript_16084/g.24136 Transcript_16084/m.24136 type:complete len:119 (+) Transcript_16084:882-1238(+)